MDHEAIREAAALLRQSSKTVALTGAAVSEDGKLLAYGLSSAGSDWQEWRVRDIDTGRDRDDRLEWVKFSGASWTHDGEGFFYSRYDAPEKASRMRRHGLDGRCRQTTFAPGALRSSPACGNSRQ